MTRVLPAGPISRRRAWFLVGIATLTMAVSYLDRQTLSVLAPTVTKALNLDDVQYGWLASAFSMAYLVGSPIAGRLIDRVGARRGLVWAVLLWSVVSGSHAFAIGFGSLFALRIALGLSEAPSFPGAAQTIQRLLPPAERSRGFGVLFTGSSIGAMLAPPIATYLSVRYGWRYAFLGTAIVGLLWIPLWMWATRPAAQTLDQAVSTGDVGAAPPMSTLFANRAVWRAVMLVLSTSPVIAFVLLWGAKMLSTKFSLPQESLPKYLWIAPVAFDLGALAFGDLAARQVRSHNRGPRLWVFVAALCTSCVGLLRFADTPWTAVIFLSIAMAGGAGLFALLTADLLSRVDPRLVSAASGVSAAAQSLAYVIANPLIGKAIKSSGSYTSVVGMLALWLVPGVAFWLLWKPQPGLAGER